MNRLLRILVCVAALASTGGAAAHADCIGCARERHDDALDDLGRSTSAGSLIGLSLGIAIGVLADREDLRYAADGFAIGTIVGFVYGIVHLAQEGDGDGAIIELDGTGPRIAPRLPDVAPDGSARWRLVGARW